MGACNRRSAARRFALALIILRASPRQGRLAMRPVPGAHCLWRSVVSGRCVCDSAVRPPGL